MLVGADTSVRLAAEEGLGAPDAVTPDLDDGPLTPDLDDGARTPSDGELASAGDNPDAVDGNSPVLALDVQHVPGVASRAGDGGCS